MTASSYFLSGRDQIPVLAHELERRLAAKGRPLRIRIEDAPSRSREQNAYLHLAIRSLAVHVGMGAEELKAHLKQQYGPNSARKVGSDTVIVPKSMGEYTREEAAEMIEHVLRLAAECGLLLSPTADW